MPGATYTSVPINACRDRLGFTLESPVNPCTAGVVSSAARFRPFKISMRRCCNWSNMADDTENRDPMAVQRWERLREAVAEWNELLVEWGRDPIKAEDLVRACIPRQRPILRLIKGAKETRVASIRKRSWRTAQGEQREAWQVDFTDQNGKRHQPQFARRKDADAWLTAARAQVQQGVFTPSSHLGATQHSDRAMARARASRGA
jgi:hypothetical protein